MKLKQWCLWRFFEDQDLFDFRIYSKVSKFFDPVNKRGIDKIKDELKGKIISEIVWSKIYSLIDADNEQNKKVKGVNKNVVKNIRHKEYIDDLLNKKIKIQMEVQCKL